MATLRDTAARRFVYGGLSTWWDPPAADREAMRDAVRRIGDLLAAEHGYRGAFGIDGVLTADGFLPTELNPRYSGGVSAIAQADPDLMTLLQMALMAGHDPGLTVEELESLTGLLDARRVGKPVAVGQGESLGEEFSYPVRYVDGRLERADVETGSTLIAADNPERVLRQDRPVRACSRRATGSARSTPRCSRTSTASTARRSATSRRPRTCGSARRRWPARRRPAAATSAPTPRAPSRLITTASGSALRRSTRSQRTSSGTSRECSSTRWPAARASSR